MLLALSRGLLARRCEAPVVRLACIRHAASVNPEPGSNSPKMTRIAANQELTFNLPQNQE